MDVESLYERGSRAIAGLGSVQKNEGKVLSSVDTTEIAYGNQETHFHVRIDFS